MHAAEHYAFKAGVIDEAEFDARIQYYLEHPDEPLPGRKDPDLLAFVDLAVKHGAPARRESDKDPAFSVGDRVTVVADSPNGHTRKARYVRGKTGVIELAHGTFINPDSAGNGGDQRRAVGGDHAEPNGVVHFDVWEPYIVSATVPATVTTGAA